MTPKEALRDLEHAEKCYLKSRGWNSVENRGVLWIDPLDPAHAHVARVAANKQRQRDANAEDMR